MAYKDTKQQQETRNPPAADAALREFVRLLARLAARDSFDYAEANPDGTSGCDHSEQEDACEAKV